MLGETEVYRKGNAIKYDLKEVLKIGILAILCNRVTFKTKELFGKTHEQELRSF